MDNLTIFIIIFIIGIILAIYLVSRSKLEHLTSNDEAIQNIANMYNIDKLTVKDAQIDELSGPTITNILNRLAVVEGRATYLNGR